MGGVFLKYLWVFFFNDSLKESHVSKRTKFHVGRCKHYIYMVPRPVNSCITIQIIDLNVCTVIVWLVVPSRSGGNYCSLPGRIGSDG